MPLGSTVVVYKVMIGEVIGRRDTTWFVLTEDGLFSVSLTELELL